MLASLPAPVRGVIASLLLGLNTIVCCTPLFIVSLFKLCLPLAAAQRITDELMRRIHETWISNNNAWINLIGNTQWQVEGLAGLDYQHSYLVTSNHQSWVDILVLQYVLNRRIRPLKFFLKQVLIWVPVIGLAWWALGFPFMKRYSKAYLDKHPEKRGKDLETTRKTCAKFRGKPTAIFNFAEGTRFTAAKHRQQQSPFKHLLKPKAGGIAFVLDAMGDQLESIIDVTIHYPEGAPGFWDLLCGRVRRIVVQFEELAIPEDFLGRSYDQDEVYRAEFQRWINRLWEVKDGRLEKLKSR
ncbi:MULTISPECIES: acyltransferase [unclassified Pseudomonas]|uniref:acyltransferase n=1 Tax=unclassified Pseudomonas TaxID=196821 RepID=UPI0021CABB0A|nr:MULTISPECIES: acyltransferase [unclassified Pseudomonas]MCU1734364.1 acyltransferase [Pseudomonas sp. 20P_3.2_Bac4]MCU1745592.1 acyltransferase [Pseudomonas sp. 20P_3.2_Bac5]